MLAESDLRELPPDDPKVKRVERIFERLLASAEGLGLSLPQTTSANVYATPESVKRQQTVNINKSAAARSGSALASRSDHATGKLFDGGESSSMRRHSKSLTLGGIEVGIDRPADRSSRSVPSTESSSVLSNLSTERVSSTAEREHDEEDDDMPFRWRLHVVDTEEFEMFVIPSGDMYMTSGMHSIRGTF